MSKPHPLLSFLSAFVAVVVVSYSLAQAAVADMIPAPLPDPVAAPAAAVDSVTVLWRSGFIVAAIIVGAYFLLAFAARTVPWLSEGKRAVYTAASVGALSTLADAASTGSAPVPAVIVSALSTAIALVLSPKPAEALPPKAGPDAP
jgi:hypothetical protein